MLMGTVSMLVHEPLVIPAVGGSVYMVCSMPGNEASAPKNVLVSHVLGAGVGWLMLGLFGLHGVPGGLAAEMTWIRLAAVALALATTNLLLRGIGCSHAPAGASTMIVAIGALPEIRHVLDFGLAALVVVVYGLLAHRIAGVDYPIWRPRPGA